MQIYQPAIQIDPKKFVKAESLIRRARVLQNYVAAFFFAMLGVLVTSLFLGGEPNRAEIGGIVLATIIIVVSLIISHKARRQASALFSEIYTQLTKQAVVSFGNDFPVQVLSALDSKEAEPFFATGDLNQNVYSAIYDRNNGEVFIRVKAIHESAQLEVLLKSESVGGEDWNDKASNYLNAQV